MTARIAFFGTPGIAVPSLVALDEADDVEVVLVVTNPDRPRARSGTPQPPPVKVAADERGLPVRQPAKPRELVDELAALDLDAVAVVAYGALLPADVLVTGGRGFVNLHFSLLPRWRGAAPVQHALRAGDEVTGVTTFVLDEGMDTGPILSRVEVPVAPDESSGELLERLAELGAPVLVDSLRALVDGATPQPQPEEGATLAPKIAPDDVAIDWSMAANDLVNLIRSANPAPGAHTVFRGKRLKIWRTRVGGPKRGLTPGVVGTVEEDGPSVAAGDSTVVLTEVQPEGKGRMSGGAFANGYQPEGELLGVR